MSQLIDKSNFPSKSDFLTLAGSHMYGLNNPNSDIDIRGYIIPPKEYVLGLDNFEHLSFIHNNEDVVIYSVKKFFSLCYNGNPNMVELLFSDKLLKNHPVDFDPTIFITNKFINNTICFIVSSMKDFLNREDKNDYKKAYHVIRLLYQLHDIIRHGKIIYPLPNDSRDHLLDIKHGLLSEDYVTNYYFKYLKDVVDSLQSLKKFPEYPDINVVNNLLKAMYEYKW